MKTYNVYIESRQLWTYVYQIQAETEEEAHLLGEKAHFDGEESLENWVDDEDFKTFQTIEENKEITK
jgi:hypothetical protein